MPGGLAARVAGWQRRAANLPGPLMSGDTYGSRRVEIYVDEAWMDITPYVYYRDSVTITRGRTSEGTQTEPSSCRFTLNNRDGRFSPRNPVSPLYGKIGRNTPIRVSVLANGERRYRFHGEVSAWPPKSDISGTDVYVPVEAAGILRRLGQGSSPLKSAMYREMTNPARANIVAYWPLEDGTTATQFASALAGGPAMRMLATGATPAAYSSWAASDALPTMGAGTLRGTVPEYGSTGEASLRIFVKLPAAGVAVTTRLVSMTTAGSARVWTVWVNPAGQFDLRAYDADGVQILATGFVTYWPLTDQMVIDVALSIGTLQTRWDLTVFSIDQSTLNASQRVVTSGTLALYTFAKITDVVVGEDGGLGDTAVGHIALADALDAFTATSGAMVAWDGENPTTRFMRLCGEESISAQGISLGRLGNTIVMGPQTRADLLALLRECADADLSVVFEPRDQLGLGWRTRLSHYNQSATLALSYASNQLAAPLDPMDDDQTTRNEITVTRTGGSSAVATLETGALSVLAPPHGVGRYDTSVTLNVHADTSLADQAGWRVHLGTVDEARYPTIALNLLHPTFTGDTAMMTAALVLDVSDRLTVSGLPAWLPPDDISQIDLGTSETIGGSDQHQITINCAPESPYRVAYADDSVLARADTAGSQLTADATPTATSLLVTTTSGPLWTTDTAEVPFDIRVGGEVMTVTRVMGAVHDDFNRTVTSGWGTLDTGQTWTTTGGTASDYSVKGV